MPQSSAASAVEGCEVVRSLLGDRFQPPPQAEASTCAAAVTPSSIVARRDDEMAGGNLPPAVDLNPSALRSGGSDMVIAVDEGDALGLASVRAHRCGLISAAFPGDPAVKVVKTVAHSTREDFRVARTA